MGVNLKPIYKWSGGKRRELKHIKEHLPKNINNYYEPFFGGGALFWFLNNIKGNFYINDLYEDNIDFLLECKYHYNKIKMNLDIFEKKYNNSSDDLKSNFYYENRIIYNDKNEDYFSKALSFYIVNQLSFSGMKRFNKKGEFNVPFGKYKTFKNQLTINHHNKLLETNLFKTDYKIFLNNQIFKENDFVFLDPPYLGSFIKYKNNLEFTEMDYIFLKNFILNNNNANFMLVIQDNKLNRSIFSKENFYIYQYDVNYNVNIKNRFNKKNKHILIKNYADI